jgi:hypothetical protein
MQLPAHSYFLAERNHAAIGLLEIDTLNRY